jgi:hypothetical protein
MQRPEQPLMLSYLRCDGRGWSWWSGQISIVIRTLRIEVIETFKHMTLTTLTTCVKCLHSNGANGQFCLTTKIPR